MRIFSPWVKSKSPRIRAPLPLALVLGSPPLAPLTSILYVAVAGTVHICIPLITSKYAVLVFQESTPAPVSPDLAAARLGPAKPVVPPGVKVALVNGYKPPPPPPLAPPLPKPADPKIPNNGMLNF
jgi:hypothetical protein